MTLPKEASTVGVRATSIHDAIMPIVSPLSTSITAHSPPTRAVEGVFTGHFDLGVEMLLLSVPSTRTVTDWGTKVVDVETGEGGGLFERLAIWSWTD